jgi:hypothetical protein
MSGVQSARAGAAVAGADLEAQPGGVIAHPASVCASTPSRSPRPRPYRDRPGPGAASSRPASGS